MSTKKPSEKLIRFPDPAILPDDSDGLIYVGGSLSVDNLVNAYSLGIFPWPLEEIYPLFWFCPQPRGVLDFDQLHIPKSLEKLRRKNSFHFTFNRDFKSVIENCSLQKRPGQEGTWIIPSLIPAYIDFHNAGYAHSIECWQQDRLVGGLYGVYVNGVFSGESMFYLEPNASKLCLIEMALKLKSLGLNWMDIQMTTPVTSALGGHYITRREFLTRLEHEHQKKPAHKLILKE